MTKAAHAVAHPFFDMKAILGLDSLKFPWNCSLTSATVGEASDAIAFTLPDGSLVADKYQELLNKAVTSMKGMKLKLSETIACSINAADLNSWSNGRATLVVRQRGSRAQS